MRIICGYLDFVFEAEIYVNMRRNEMIQEK